VRKKCKKRMNQGRWTKDLKRTLFLERGGRRETKYHFCCFDVVILVFDSVLYNRNYIELLIFRYVGIVFCEAVENINNALCFP